MKLFSSCVVIFVLSLAVAVFLTVGAHVLGFTAVVQTLVFLGSFFSLITTGAIAAGNHLANDDEYGLYN